MSSTLNAPGALPVATLPIAVALMGVLSFGCSRAAATELEPTSSTTVVVSFRADPNLTPTTLPPVSAFIEQPDGSLVAVISDVSLEEGVLFEYGSAVLTPAAFVAIVDLLPEILAHRGNIAVHGWTDGVGTEQSNLVLSNDRAASVVSFLQAVGVTAEIEVIGHGEDGSEEGIADPIRRRVEIVLEVAS